MTERTFRIFLGAGLFVLLYISALMGRTDLILFYIGLLVFEGITNWRVPKVLTLVMHKFAYNESDMNTQELLTPAVEQAGHFNIPFEAERALRLFTALVLAFPLIFPLELLWIIPWVVASMLLLAGLTNICPLVMIFRRLGFK